MQLAGRWEVEGVVHPITTGSAKKRGNNGDCRRNLRVQALMPAQVFRMNIAWTAMMSAKRTQEKDLLQKSKIESKQIQASLRHLPDPVPRACSAPVTAGLSRLYSQHWDHPLE
eukprot:1158955-Pelagomonas_calceolata.AAC.24